MFKLFNIQQDNYIRNDKELYNSGKSEQAVLISSSVSKETELTISPALESRYLCKFDTTEILNNISGSINDNDITLKFRLSDLRKKNNNFEVVAYPLSSSFDEGLGKNFNSKLGSTWKYRSDDVEWTSYGGDYINDYRYTGSIDEEKKEMTIDLMGFLQEIQSGSFENNGLLLKIESDEVYRLSFYSKDTLSGNEPKIFIEYDNHIYNSGSTSSSAVHFTGSYLRNSFDFISYNHGIELTEGDTFQSQIDIDFKYRRRGLNYRDVNYFVENVTYSLFDKTRDKWFLNNNSKNKLDLDVDSMYISFPTNNFPEGTYDLFCTHTSGSYTVKSKVTTLRVNV